MAWTPNYPGAEAYPVRNGWASDRSGTDIDTLIVHVMVGSYEGSMNWAQTNPHRTSFHYGVAKDGRIGQAVDERWAAHHAGNWGYNLRSIGIEHEDNQEWNTPGWMTKTQFEKSTDLAAHLCKKYDIPVNRIIPHHLVASDGRSCPGPHFPIEKYRNRVTEKLSGSVFTPLPTKDRLYRVIAGTFKTRAGAYERSAAVKAKGFEAAVVFESPYFKVLAGSFRQRERADDRVMVLVAMAGIEAYVNPVELKQEKEKESPTMGINLNKYTPTSRYGLTPHTDRVRQHIEEVFGPVTISGFRNPGDGTEHATRTAVDFVVGNDGAKGKRIAEYIAAHNVELGAEGEIWWAQQTGYNSWGYSRWGFWKKQFWNPYNHGWTKAMVDARDAFHYKHVHLKCFK